MTGAAAILASGPLALAQHAPGEPGWLTLALLCGLGGLLVLDDTALAQTWFSQPLPVGLLAGAVCGDPATGLALGLPVQLILAGNLPVGQTFTGDPVPPVVAVVGATIMAGHALPRTLDAAVVDLPFVGWLILAVGLFSSLGHFLVAGERRLHTLWMLDGHRTLRDGRLDRVDRLQARCLVLTFVRGAATTGLLLWLITRLWLPLFEHLPAGAGVPLAILPLLLPGLGIGNLIGHYGLRSSWRWVASGAVVSFVVTRYVL